MISARFYYYYNYFLWGGNPFWLIFFGGVSGNWNPTALLFFLYPVTNFLSIFKATEVQHIFLGGTGSFQVLEMFCVLSNSPCNTEFYAKLACTQRQNGGFFKSMSLYMHSYITVLFFLRICANSCCHFSELSNKLVPHHKISRGGGTQNIKWQGWFKNVLGIETFRTWIFGGRKIWQVSFCRCLDLIWERIFCILKTIDLNVLAA